MWKELQDLPHPPDPIMKSWISQSCFSNTSNSGFVALFWQLYEDSVRSQLSVSNQVTEHRECTTQCPDALPGLDTLLGAPVSGLIWVYPTPPAFSGRQVGSQDLYWAMVTSRRHQKGTAESHHSCSPGLMPQRISEPTRSHGAGPTLAPGHPPLRGGSLTCSRYTNCPGSFSITPAAAAGRI